jgi:hypothetical protein
MDLSGKREAFRVDSLARGLDHQRTTWIKKYGDYEADSATSFEAGGPVALNSSGKIVVHPGTDTKPFGIACYNKTNTITAAVSAEPIQFATAGSTATLDHSNIVSHGTNTGGLRITSTATGGTDYTVATDFTYVSTSGVVTQIAAGSGGSIPLGTTVYAWYKYNVTVAEVQDSGLNFWNFTDDVSIQGNKISVITGLSTIFTTQYNPARAWAINDDVTVGNEATDHCGGLFDRATSSTNTVVIGKVIQLPNADDPFLGIQYY